MGTFIATPAGAAELAGDESSEAATATVESYLLAHPRPTPPVTESRSGAAASVELSNKYADEMHEFWSEFPWAAGLARAGCTLEGPVEIQMAQPDDSKDARFPVVELEVNCPSAALPTVTQLTSATEPDVQLLGSNCPVVISGGSHCLNIGAGRQDGSYTWQGTLMYGRLQLGTASVVSPSCNTANGLVTGGFNTYNNGTQRLIGAAYAMSANWFLAFRQATSSGADTGIRSYICAA